jgi:hypothetical protein
MDSFEPFDATKKNPDGYGPTYEEWQAQLKKEEDAKEALRKSAFAKLAKLGLTEDEARAVVGV